MKDLIERLRDWEPCVANGICRVHNAESGCICAEAADALEQKEWVSVEDELPVNPRRVWFSWINKLGNRRTGAGSYARKFEVSADHEDEPGIDPEVYDWKGETPYRKPGWYEEPHESEYYYLVTDEVTHWMPLPAPPEAT